MRIPISFVRLVTEYDITPYKPTEARISATTAKMPSSVIAKRRWVIESATILAIVVLGGMGSQVGVAIAAVVMIGGTEILRELDFLKRIFGADFDPAQYRMLIFGFGMVVMMIWKPRGIISTREPSIFLKERKAISGSLVKEGHG